MNPSLPTQQLSPSTRRPDLILLGALSLVVAISLVIIFLTRHTKPPFKTTIPKFSVPVGKVHDPLPYRIISFHHFDHIDKNIIQLASQLGYNGVQIQIEGSNEKGVRAFAEYDRIEHLVDFCHTLNMKVTVWVREFSDLPPDTSPDYLGPPTVTNDKIWSLLDRRYEGFLRRDLANVDGLVLTCVESQIKATDTDVLLKLVGLIDDKCRRFGKQLTLRTFVWHPEDLDTVIAAIRRMPRDIVIMSKAVPQDWQMRAPNAAEIGAVGDHEQLIEYDVAGEYFLSDAVANCMVDRLKEQYDYGITKGVKGICARVDRYDASVLWTPNEVNLWALGLLSAGVSDDKEDIWNRWASYRYGEKAAPAVIAALKPTSQVVSEMVSVGPFTLGDTRGADEKTGVPAYLVPLPYRDIMGEYKLSNLNWQMWKWDPTLLPTRDQIEYGDPVFIDGMHKEQAAAQALADQCLADLEKARPLLPEKEYQILYTRLLTNKVQLAYRSAATMAALHIRQYWAALTLSQADHARELYNQDLDAIQALCNSLASYPPPTRLDYLEKTWEVNYPLRISPQQLTDWLAAARKPPRF